MIKGIGAVMVILAGGGLVNDLLLVNSHILVFFGVLEVPKLLLYLVQGLFGYLVQEFHPSSGFPVPPVPV